MTVTRPFILGLTGSIGMGKSTTAAMFVKRGVPVWDADAAVHRLYEAGGTALDPIGVLCPTAISDQGVDRARLRDWIATDDGALKRLESVVHPLVAADRATFVDAAARNGDGLIVVDIPLLFETCGDEKVDAVLVVSAPIVVQRHRVLQRPDMTKAHFERILSGQMPDSEKRARADYVIETTSMQAAEIGVDTVLAAVQNRKPSHA